MAVGGEKMPNVLSTLFNEVSSRIFPDAEEVEEEELVSTIDDARREWLSACSFFNEVSDPDLVDMAIYSMDAAEKRYIYLLKLAKVKGL